MISKILKVLTKMSAAFICLFFVAYFFTGCSFGNKNNGYAISGYVFDELGAPVENVTISSELGEVKTDATGKYTISNIKESILLKPSISGYHFKEQSKKIASKNDDANFVAYEEYTAFGVVDNNGLVVPSARVEISSLAGTFQTMTDENGRFEASGVAGEATLECVVSGDKYYTAKTTIENPSVKINSTSDFTLSLNIDDGSVDYSKISLKIDGESLRVFEASTTFKDMKYGMTIELESNYYRFSKNTINITELNQITNVDVFKVYSVAGVVKSGEVPLANANVYLDNSKVTMTDQNGNFLIDDVIKNRKVSVSYENFVFETVDVSHKNTTALFNGTKTITLSVDADYVADGQFSFSTQNFVQVNNSTYKFTGVTLGSNIELQSEIYHLSSNVIEVGENDYYGVTASILYNSSLQIDLNCDYQVLLDGKVVSVDDLCDLYGTHTVSASYSNYVFSSQIVSFGNEVATITYQIPYSVSIAVCSGDELLSSAYAIVAGRRVSANSNAVITIENLTGLNIISVACDLFNSEDIEVSGQTETEVNLSYNISGVVQTGNIPVSMANILVAGKETQTNSLGYFEVKEIYGRAQVVAQKENNVIQSYSVFGESEIELNGTYSISGVLSSESGVVANQTVYLRAVSSENHKQTTTNENGYYEFSELSEIYQLLTYDASGNVLLKPEYYTVYAGGVYNFSMSGFKISGYVKTGDVPISNAYVVAGSESTYTNTEGYFVFELLTSKCEVFVQKSGYVFSSNVSVEEDAENVNFTATYSISGKVTSATYAISGVSVLVDGTSVTTTDENGVYQISGLSGEVLVSFEKAGYQFDGTHTISAYGTYNITCKAQKSITILSGDIPVNEVEVYVNGKLSEITTANISNIVANIGDEVTFVKTGYTISNLVINENSSYVATATYGISGKVVSGERAIANALVSVGNTKITTNALGEFFVEGLSGQTSISAEKTGFSASSVSVSGHSNSLEINLSYSVSGTVYVGTKAISGALVTVGTKTATTDENGKFEFSEISGTFSIICEKEGYTFEIQENLFGTQKVTFMAKYSISGYVKSGSLAVSNADLTLYVENSSETKQTKSDVNGYFEFVGLLGTTSIIIEKEGYTSAELAGIVDSDSNIEFDLSYSYTFNFEASPGIVVYNVNIYVNGTLKGNNGSFGDITISNLKGANTITFEKANTLFSPNGFIISVPGTQVISHSVAYDIYGKVTIDGTSLGASNVSVKSGTKEVLTNENGEYSLTDVAGSVSISNSSLNPNGDSISISGNGEYNLTVSNFNYAYFLYETGYANLSNNQTGFAIVGKGEVSPSIGGNQSVYSISKKDASGNRIKQNLNYGSEVLGVDPKVSLLAYYDLSENQWYYEQTKSVKSNLTASHDKNNLLGNPVSVAQYQSVYGAAPDAFHPYNFTKSTGISSISTITESGGDYYFTITLSTSLSVYSMYAQQMKTLADQTVKSFSYIYLNYTIDKDGWITKLYIDEKYTVELMSVSITSKINYYFTKANETIDAINLNNINASLKQNSLVGLYLVKKYDIITKVIYGY